MKDRFIYIKKIVKLLLFFILIFIIFFCLGEAGIRFYLKDHVIKFDKTIAENPLYASDLLYINQPYVSRINKIGNDQAFTHFNRLGFKDYDYAFKKQPNVYRIVVLGDSVTYGFGAEQSQSYPKLLESKLNSESNGEKVYEVLNMAIPSYGPPDYYTLTKRLVLRFNPDLIIISFYLADDHLDSLNWEINKQYRFLRSIPDQIIYYPVNQFLKENSYLWMILLDRYYGFAKTYEKRRLSPEDTKKFGFYEAQVDTNSPSMKKAWRLTEDYLRLINQITQEKGIKLAVVSVPAREQIIPDDWERIAKEGFNVDSRVFSNPTSRQNFADLCLQNRWNCLSLTENLLAANNSQILFLDKANNHFSAAGLQIITQTIFSYLVKNQFIDFKPGVNNDN